MSLILISIVIGLGTYNLFLQHELRLLKLELVTIKQSALINIKSDIIGAQVESGTLILEQTHIALFLLGMCVIVVCLIFRPSSNNDSAILLDTLPKMQNNFFAETNKIITEQVITSYAGLETKLNSQTDMLEVLGKEIIFLKTNLLPVSSTVTDSSLSLATNIFTNF